MEEEDIEECIKKVNAIDNGVMLFAQNMSQKFEGIKNVNGGYGPNYPVRGNMYDRNGDLIFSGRFEYQKGGVGFPMMRYPRYRFEEDDAPKIKYLSLTLHMIVISRLGYLSFTLRGLRCFLCFVFDWIPR